ncbi:response regulator transcription factor [Brucepastera parasyntrophica]|uniref:response regulator transcription factor n=1 Tax=Brucepastera parasyntrophica TaxID=2880008 RepID=UPI00210DAEDF|nr:response regulator transcription factor [Brucepastera parasyntrophica]ULQ60517.1 response regulator transcription factor [Brucepastera parasyntrophica]
MALILIADDEPSVRDAVRIALTRDGHEVYSAADGVSAWKIIEDQPGIELAVLDIMMGGLEGTAILSRLRVNANMLPVILLTSRDDEIDRLGGFSIGADDYIGKPFSVRELCARVRAVLRRSQSVKTPALQSRGLRIDSEAFRCWYDGAELKLTISEFRILLALQEHSGGALSREQLLRRAWPQDTWIDERSVDSHVKRLRQKLQEAGAADIIKTVYGLGYRLEEDSAD